MNRRIDGIGQWFPSSGSSHVRKRDGGDEERLDPKSPRCARSTGDTFLAEKRSRPDACRVARSAFRILKRDASSTCAPVSDFFRARSIITSDRRACSARDWTSLVALVTMKLGSVCDLWVDLAVRSTGWVLPRRASKSLSIRSPSVDCKGPIYVPWQSFRRGSTGLLRYRVRL